MKKSLIYLIVFPIIIFGYFFFFASEMIFSEKTDFVLTEINTTQQLTSEISLTLKEWLYSPADRAMLVYFQADNNSPRQLDINYLTVQRQNGKVTDVKTEIYIPFDNLVIAYLTGISPNFEEISLRLQLDSDNDTANDIINFYTNKDAVEKTDSIKKKSNNEYRIDYLNIRITEQEEKINALREENKELTANNEEYQAAIDELVINEPLQTPDEVANSEARIKVFNEKIQSNNKQIETNNADITALQEKISEIKVAIEKIKDNEGGSSQ